MFVVVMGTRSFKFLLCSLSLVSYLSLELPFIVFLRESLFFSVLSAIISYYCSGRLTVMVVVGYGGGKAFFNYLTKS